MRIFKKSKIIITKSDLRKNGYCLFLKGKKLEEEIGLAKKAWKFDHEIFPSLTSEEGKIIKIYNIKPISNNS